MSKGKELAGIEYHGRPGISEDCRDAVIRILQYGEDITHARIVSYSNHHCLLLTTSIGDHIAIKSGFASGYGGGGPTSFSYTLQLLDLHRIEIEECEVDEALVARLDKSALTTSDLERINSAKPIRPHRWHDYIMEGHYESAKDGTLWKQIQPVIPFAIVDSRIVDLALSFWEDPDDKLLKGYRRLEEIVRRRAGISEHGEKLFSRAFRGVDAELHWSDLNGGEVTGRANLFTGAYLAHRNPRAHQELKTSPVEQVSEFFLLNHLYRLEKQSRSIR